MKLDQGDLINLIKSMDTKESCTKAGLEIYHNI